jgi:hypothetical protein
MNSKYIISIFIIIMALIMFAGCVFTPYKARIRLVNNYTDSASFILNENLDYVTESGGDYTVDEGVSGAQILISSVEAGEKLTQEVALPHDIYGVFDWTVFYVAERDGTGEIVDWDCANLTEINDDYRFEYQTLYIITLDENLDITIEEEPMED